MDKPLLNSRKLGLVLGGGGAKCFAHLGIVDELNRQQIPIDQIVSSSMGSLMGILIANRVPTEKIKQEFYRRLTRLKWIKPTLSRHGFLSQSNVVRLLKDLLPETRLEKAAIPISIVATDLTDGRQVLFEEGDAIEAVCASSAFPGIYKPIIKKQHILADGGIVNNIPADICREKMGTDEVVISAVLDGPFDTSLGSLGSSFQIVWRSIYIPLIKSRKAIVEANSDLILSPLEDVYLSFRNWKDILKFHNREKMEGFYEKGREAAQKALPQIIQLMASKANEIKSSNIPEPSPPVLITG